MMQFFKTKSINTFATEIFKEVELNKNNFEDFNQSFLFVKDTFKITFKKTIKEKYLVKSCRLLKNFVSFK
jgi:hypothetical protein